jgi:hypothetical protein
VYILDGSVQLFSGGFVDGLVRGGVVTMAFVGGPDAWPNLSVQFGLVARSNNVVMVFAWSSAGNHLEF